MLPTPMPMGKARAYVYLISASLMWSAVGLLVKGSALMVNSHIISFLRFFVGVAFLLILMKWNRIPLHLSFKHPLIWLAAAGKAVNYIFENLGISWGPAWGNVIVGPVQTIVLVTLAAFYFKEAITLRKVAATAGCIAGVLLLRGQPGAPGLSWAIIGLMVVSGVGAALHVFYQRRMVDSMESLNLNTSIFLAASLLTAMPLPVFGHLTGSFNPISLLAVLGLGLITGLSFHLFALAIRAIPMVQVTILSNVGFLFTPVWANLVFGDPISARVLTGAAISIGAIVLVSWPAAPPVAPPPD